jgi:hypothetical protein
MELQEAPPSSGETNGIVHVCPRGDCKPAAASWAYDDSNALCFDELERAGIRGTFYLIGYAEQRNACGFPRYRTAGPELAARAMHHQCGERLFLGESDAYAQEELEPNIRAIEALTARPVLTAAWPSGCVVPDRISAAQRYVIGARGLCEPPGSLSYHAACSHVQENPVQTTPENGYNLPSYANVVSGKPFRTDALDRTVHDQGWITVTAHPACDGIAELARRKADLWIAPIGEVLRYISVRDHTLAEQVKVTDHALTLSTRHTLLPLVRPAPRCFPYPTITR